MDQTMVRFDEPYARTNDIAGKSTIRITNTGCKKRGFTVALAATASGHKLPAFVILKEPTGRIPPRVLKDLKVPHNVKVTCSFNGWMTTNLMESWLTRIWGPNEDDVRRLIILDRASIHRTSSLQEKLKDLDTDLVLIPAGCTGLLQPADVSWMAPFKSALRREWAVFIRNKQKTLAGNLKRPTRQDVIGFVSAAWEAVTEETISKSFKRCGISNALDGSEDGLFHTRLAEVNVGSVDNDITDELNEECVNLILDDDSDISFNGFSDND
uniref:POGO family transposase, putative n=1 Tax=Parasteatoda tepidariorum TaxID=114398 RepID=A0A2L2YHJ1_PARTP